MRPSFGDYLASCQRRVNQTLEQISRPSRSEYCGLNDTSFTASLYDALRYGLLEGGKRVRPTLVYASAEAVSADCDPGALDYVAASIECLHCYSLIHDDLPTMDDDDLRRGQPTCHKAYDEATAILAGDGLQTLAFELLADCPTLEARQRIALVKTLAAASGVRGMVGGQYIDLSLESHAPALELLQTMHSLKTGALIRASVSLGGIAAGAESAQLQALDHYGNLLGLAFQVKDDLLDIEGSTEELGKRQGSDLHNDKMTYPALLGLEGSRTLLQQLLEQGLAALEPLGESATQLRQLGHYIINRNH